MPRFACLMFLDVPDAPPAESQQNAQDAPLPDQATNVAEAVTTALSAHPGLQELNSGQPVQIAVCAPCSADPLTITRGCIGPIAGVIAGSQCPGTYGAVVSLIGDPSLPPVIITTPGGRALPVVKLRERLLETLGAAHLAVLQSTLTSMRTTFELLDRVPTLLDQLAQEAQEAPQNATDVPPAAAAPSAS